MKDWWKSKTLWINTIAIASIIIRAELGWTITPEHEVLALGIVNLVLRLITKEQLE